MSCMKSRFLRKAFRLLLWGLCLTELATSQTANDAKLSLEERVFTASKVYSQAQSYSPSEKDTTDPALDALFKS
jgi:hypothetical protein